MGTVHLKANRKLASGGRVTNGELVTVKSGRADGGVELTDGRVLDKSFREFLPGYAVTSYGSQGKTVDYVLFSDSTVKPATNAQQWYVTISRGRRGIGIFTPDKQQLRENITRSGHRPLAMEFAASSVPRGQHRLWNRLHGYLIRSGRRAAERIFRLHQAQQHQPKHQTIQKHEHKNTRMLGRATHRHADYALKQRQSVHCCCRTIISSLRNSTVAVMSKTSSSSLPRTKFPFAAIIYGGLKRVMQRLELSLLAKLPNSQRKLITEGQPIVLEIAVTAIRDAETG